MKFVILLFCIFAVASAIGVLPPPRFPLLRHAPVTGYYDAIAASLGGAPVGTFERNTDPFGGSEITASSMNGAKVGLAGKNRLPSGVNPLLPQPLPFLPLYNHGLPASLLPYPSWPLAA